jgi:hypothetical protein
MNKDCSCASNIALIEWLTKKCWHLTNDGLDYRVQNKTQGSNSHVWKCDVGFEWENQIRQRLGATHTKRLRELVVIRNLDKEYTCHRNIDSRRRFRFWMATASLKLTCYEICPYVPYTHFTLHLKYTVLSTTLSDKQISSEQNKIF